MRPTCSLNPGRLGAAAQCRYFPSSSGSQIVHNRSSPCASTNRAMIVSTSGREDPEKINLRMLSTDSLEKRLGSFGAASRSEEHTSELQSHHDLVCRLLLEKKKK